MKTLPKHSFRQCIAISFREGQHMIPAVVLSLLRAVMKFKHMLCPQTQQNQTNPPRNLQGTFHSRILSKGFRGKKGAQFSFTILMLFHTFALQGFCSIKWARWAIASVPGIKDSWSGCLTVWVTLAGIKLQTISIRFNREVQTKDIWAQLARESGHAFLTLPKRKFNSKINVC